VRLITARNVDDLGVAASMLGLAVTTAWVVAGTAVSHLTTDAAAGAAPVSALIAGVLSRRRGLRTAS
jgi:hypothetical protein